MSDIMVYCSQRNGRITKGSFEALGAARFLAESLDCTVGSALIGGEGIDEYVQELAAYGARKVYLCKDRRLEQYRPEIHLHVG